MTKYTSLVLASIVLANHASAQETEVISLDQFTRKCASMYQAALGTEEPAPMQAAALCMETAAIIGDFNGDASLYASFLTMARPALDQHCLETQLDVMTSYTHHSLRPFFRKKDTPTYTTAEAKQDYETRKTQMVDALKKSAFLFYDAAEVIERAHPQAGKVREFQETKDGIKIFVAKLVAEMEAAQCGFGDITQK